MIEKSNETLARERDKGTLEARLKVADRPGEGNHRHSNTQNSIGVVKKYPVHFFSLE